LTEEEKEEEKHKTLDEYLAEKKNRHLMEERGKKN